jgi:hypothetical protein
VSGKPAPWFERLFWKAPWLVVAAVAAGVLPGYFWWLATGDAQAAEEMVKVAFPCAFAGVLFFWGFWGFCVPFIGQDRPPLGQRVVFALAGAMMWAWGVVVLGALALRSSLLPAARAATAAFAVGFAAGLALQRHRLRRCGGPQKGGKGGGA